MRRERPRRARVGWRPTACAVALPGLCPERAPHARVRPRHGAHRLTARSLRTHANARGVGAPRALTRVLCVRSEAQLETHLDDVVEEVADRAPGHVDAEAARVAGADARAGAEC